MGMLLAGLTIIGSFIILTAYGLELKKGDLWEMLKDPKTLTFSILNILDANASLDYGFRQMDFFDKAIDIIISVAVTLILATISLLIVYGVISIFGRKPTEEEDISAFTAARKLQAFWWCMGINIIIAMYLFSIGVYRF